MDTDRWRWWLVPKLGAACRVVHEGRGACLLLPSARIEINQQRRNVIRDQSSTFNERTIDVLARKRQTITDNETSGSSVPLVRCDATVRGASATAPGRRDRERDVRCGRTVISHWLSRHTHHAFNYSTHNTNAHMPRPRVEQSVLTDRPILRRTAMADV